MKKLLLFLSIVVLVPLLATAQVQIGTSTLTRDPNNNNSPLKAPFYAPFAYSYAQSIYLSSEINATGTITTISWYYAGNGALENSQDLVVYMGHTSKGSFYGLSDFIPLYNLTQVYHGSLTTNSTAGWKTITLDTPFAYNGTGNLVIAVDENSYPSDDFTNLFYNSPVDGRRSLTNWTSSVDINPASPGTAPSDTGWNYYVPNIILGGIKQLCLNPTGLQASNITSNGATISWEPSAVAPAGGSDYYINYTGLAPTANTPPTGHIESGNSATVGSLYAGGVTYYVWVRNLCENNARSSWSSKCVFRTDCEAQGDFIEYFDNDEAPALPSCWRTVLRGPGLSDSAAIKSFNTGSPQSSPNMVEMYNSYSTTSSDILLISPRLSNLSAGTNHLTFYAKGRFVAVQVGTMDKNDKDGVFTPFESFSPATYTSWTQYDIDFKPYRGTDHYIALRLDVSNEVISPGDNTPHFVDLDTFNWEFNSSCPAITGIKALSTTTASATIGWDPSAVNGYQAAFTSNDSVIDPNTLTPLDPVSSSSQQIDGLTAGTTYKYWVRSVCNGENGNWQGPYLVTTTCSAITKIKEDFETVTSANLPACWGKIIRGETQSIGSSITTETINGNTLVQLYSASGNQGDDVILVSPKLTSLHAGGYRLKFYARSGTSVKLQVGTLSTNTEAAVFTEVQKIQLTDGMVQYTVEFGEASADTFIGFRISDFGAHNGVLIDDINWEFSPQCSDVTGLSVTGLSYNETTSHAEAKIEWTAGGGETSWLAAKGSVTDTDPDLLEALKFDINPSAFLQNLTPNTDYKVWVRSYCSSTELGAWSEPISFKTVCSPPNSINEDFESAAVPNLPNCWNKIVTGYTGSAQIPPYVKTTQYGGANKEVTLHRSDADAATNIILVSPYVSNLATGKYRIRFTAKGDADLQLGTLNSTLEAAVFKPIQSVSVSHNPKEYVVDFSSAYGTTDKYIGLRLSSDKTYAEVQVDTIVWELIPPCQDVTGLQVGYTTMDSATINWNADSSSLWQFVYGDATDTDPDSLVPYDVHITAVKLLDQLTAGKTYNVWVRSVCENEGTHGAWRGPLKVTTQCDAVSIPYSENFETTVLPNMPLCTSSKNLAESPSNWYTGNNPGYGFQSNALIYDSNADTYVDANAWFFTRGIMLNGGQNYNLSFRYGGASDGMVNGVYLYENSLRVMAGTEANASSMNTMVEDIPSIHVKAPVAKSVSFVPATTGVYYFGFNVYSPNNSYFMYVDDILIDSTLANNEFNISDLNYYPNPVKDMFTISHAENISTVEVYNVLGQQMLAKTINDTVARVDMSALLNGAYLVKVVSGESVKTIKIVKQ